MCWTDSLKEYSHLGTMGVCTWVCIVKRNCFSFWIFLPPSPIFNRCSVCFCFLFKLFHTICFFIMFPSSNPFQILPTALPSLLHVDSLSLKGATGAGKQANENNNKTKKNAKLKQKQNKKPTHTNGVHFVLASYSWARGCPGVWVI